MASLCRGAGGGGPSPRMVAVEGLARRPVPSASAPKLGPLHGLGLRDSCQETRGFHLNQTLSSS